MLVVILVVGIGSTAGILFFAEAGVYTENYRDVVNRVLYSETRAIANVTMSYLEDGDTEGVIAYLKNTNAEVALLQERLSNRIGGDTYIWTSYDKTQYENVDNRPYWEYVAVMDASTRPEHAMLNGLVYRYDDPFWQSFYPPNGWRCRCRVNALSDYNLQKKNVAQL